MLNQEHQSRLVRTTHLRIYLCTCLPTDPSIDLSVCPTTNYPHIHLSTYRPIDQSTLLSTIQSLYLSIYPSIHQSTNLFIYLSIFSSPSASFYLALYPSLHLSISLLLSVCSSLYLFLSMPASIHLYIHLSVSLIPYLSV